MTDGQTDRRTDRRTDWTIHRAAWSQLKIDGVTALLESMSPGDAMSWPYLGMHTLGITVSYHFDMHRTKFQVLAHGLPHYYYLLSCLDIWNIRVLWPNKPFMHFCRLLLDYYQRCLVALTWFYWKCKRHQSLKCADKTHEIKSRHLRAKAIVFRPHCLGWPFFVHGCHFNIFHTVAYNHLANANSRIPRTGHSPA